jgi:hypothetical protein
MDVQGRGTYRFNPKKILRQLQLNVSAAFRVSHVPSTNVREIAAMLKAIHACEDVVAARQKAIQVIVAWCAPRLTGQAAWLR